jgi:hypothetical protein
MQQRPQADVSTALSDRDVYPWVSQIRLSNGFVTHGSGLGCGFGSTAALSVNLYSRRSPQRTGVRVQSRAILSVIVGTAVCRRSADDVEADTVRHLEGPLAPRTRQETAKLEVVVDVAAGGRGQAGNWTAGEAHTSENGNLTLL